MDGRVAALLACRHRAAARAASSSYQAKTHAGMVESECKPMPNCDMDAGIPKYLI